MGETATEDLDTRPMRDGWRQTARELEKEQRASIRFSPATPLLHIRLEGGIEVNFEREAFELITFRGNKSGMNGD